MNGMVSANGDLPGFRERLGGQVFGLFLWPLMTVILVAGALYFNRVSNLNDLAVQKEALLVKSIRMLLEAERNSAVADLKQLLTDPAFVTAATVRTSAGDGYLTQVLKEIVEENQEYEQVCVYDRIGAPVVQVRSPAVTGSDGGRPGNEALQEDFFAAIQSGPPGKLHTFPHILTLHRSGDEVPEDPMLRIGARVASNNGEMTVIVIIDYRLTSFVELVREIGSGNRGMVMIAGSYPDLAKNLAKMAKEQDLPIWLTVVRQLAGSVSPRHLFVGGNLYSSDVLSVSSGIDLGGGLLNGEDNGAETALQRVIVAELPASFFREQKVAYLALLAILAVALLVPSFVVCLFWARARIKARQEARLRAVEQVEHLVSLEQQVRERTRELDDRNLQLSAEIAERLNAEFRLRQLNELLSGMIESIDGIIYVADFQTHEILFANAYLKQLFGFDPVGKKCWQFIHASQDGPCSFCVNHNLLDSNGVPAGSYEWEYQNPFNKKWYHAKDLAIRWSNGKYVKLEIAIDISEQKRLQRFLKEARKQAENARKMRSRFVALVAHDLKSPFYSITQMLKRILERETFTNKVHRQFLENIVTNGHRMLQMIDDLLSMGRFETAEVKLERTFFNVAVMVDEVIDNFRLPASEKSLTVVNRLPSECWVYADKYLYFVVLNNLLSNAIKFSETGGTIQIFPPDPEAPMTVAVQDEGRGMSQEFVDNLFKADVKTSCTGTKGEPGSGLGLLFCQEILKAHGGSLTVRSTEGVGTVFTIQLPECCALGRYDHDGEGIDDRRGNEAADTESR